METLRIRPMKKTATAQMISNLLSSFIFVTLVTLSLYAVSLLSGSFITNSEITNFEEINSAVEMIILSIVIIMWTGCVLLNVYSVIENLIDLKYMYVDVTDDMLIIGGGVLVKLTSYLKRSDIQYITVKSNFIEKKFDVYKLIIHMAGSKLIIESLVKDQADTLKNILDYYDDKNISAQDDGKEIKVENMEG